MPPRFRRTASRPKKTSRNSRLHRLHPVRRLSDLPKSRRQRDLDLITLYADRTTGDGKVGVACTFSRPHVELPSVPGAFDDVAGQIAFPERPPRMGAGVVDGVE